jgi:kinesin family protein 15
METLIKVTYVEIYNEKIFDLLTEENQALNLREDLKQGVYIENVTEEIINSS